MHGNPLKTDIHCIDGFAPISIKKFLQTIGVDGSQGLGQALHTDKLNVDFVAQVIAGNNGWG